MRKSKTQMKFKKLSGWGGKRARAGRPNRSGQIGHARRPTVKASTPMHVTWRLGAKGVNLRCGEVFDIFKTSAEGSKNFGLRILHFSLQGNHLHMLVEAGNNSDLTRGLRSFAIRFVKALKKIVSISGPLFKGRYHLHVLKSPTEMKLALAYVLQNFSKHTKRIWHVDRYSSAPHFGQWKVLFGRHMGPLLEGIDGPNVLPRYLSAPRSWLAREGWLRATRAT